jgi:hypothetical protein
MDSRYTPQLVSIVRQLAVDGTVDEFKLPELPVLLASPTATTTSSTPLRKSPPSCIRARDWRFMPFYVYAGKPSRSASTAVSPEAATSRDAPQTFIVFVIGGVTASEIRAVHDAVIGSRNAVILGGTCVTNPTRFVEELRYLPNE